jgi:phosphotransferase system enzyme I (PtsP)
MFAADRGWLQRMTDAVRSGITAEAAVQKVLDDTRVRMHQISDPYIRERLLDLEDLANRLQQHLAGKLSGAEPAELPPEFILIARSMGPAELLDYDRARLKGLVLEEGSPTAHVAIVARALDIPVIGRAKDCLAKIEAGDLVVADGDNAQVFVRPGEDILQAVEESILARTAQRESYALMRDLPATTRDGIEIELHMNAGLILDLPALDATGAVGIGLYRTEIPFMVRHDFPDVPTQADLYGRILDAAQGKPVVFRTLDIGGDKLLPYLPDMEDENPAMGWRAIRIALDRPAMLRQQLRALVRAAGGRELRVMFPMIAEVAEFRQAREVLDLELRRAADRGGTVPNRILAGVMLEVPSLMWQLPALLPEVDFVSVGTNDLMQFLFACDRGNPKLAGRYDVLSPAFLAVLRELVAKANAAGKPVCVCGEMAGHPIEAMALVGLGFRQLSMAPSGIGPVKTMIRSVRFADLAELLDGVENLADHTLRPRLRAFARDHDVLT